LSFVLHFLVQIVTLLTADCSFLGDSRRNYFLFNWHNRSLSLGSNPSIAETSSRILPRGKAQPAGAITGYD
jgi:hypothetical protein